MGQYLLPRLVVSVPVLLGTPIATYTIITSAPGDPLAAVGGHGDRRATGVARRLAETPHPPGPRPGAGRGRAADPLHPLQYARGDPPGLREHRAGEGAARAHRHLSPRPAQRADPAGDHRR